MSGRRPVLRRAVIVVGVTLSSLSLTGCHELYCAFVEGLTGQALDCSHEEFPDFGDFVIPSVPPPPPLPTTMGTSSTTSTSTSTSTSPPSPTTTTTLPEPTTSTTGVGTTTTSVTVVPTTTTFPPTTVGERDLRDRIRTAARAAR